MDFKAFLLVFVLAGVVSAYNASVEPNLDDAPVLLLNETHGLLEAGQVKADDIVLLGIVVCFLVILILLLIVFLGWVLGWIH